MKDLSDIIAEGLYQGLLRFEQYLAKEKGSSVATFMAPAPAEKLEVVSPAVPDPDMGGAVPKKTKKHKATAAVAKVVVEEPEPVVEELEPEAAKVVVGEPEPVVEDLEPEAEEPAAEAAPADHAAFMGRVFGLVREHKNGPEAGSSLAMALIKNKFGLEKFKLAKPEQFVAILTALKEAL